MSVTWLPLRWKPPEFTGPPRFVWVTPMQAAVLESLCEGKDTDGIRADWGISRNTVKTHVAGLLAAAGARDRPQLIAWTLAGRMRVWVKPVDHRHDHRPGVLRAQSMPATLATRHPYSPAL